LRQNYKNKVQDYFKDNTE